MTLREQLKIYIDELPETRLAILSPLLQEMVNLYDNSFIIETDLTDEEKKIISDGELELKNNPDCLTPLSEIL